MKYGTFDIANAMRTIKIDECEKWCEGYKFDNYCKKCQIKIALDIMQDEYKRALKREKR